MGFKDQVVIITGASRGIGLSIAKSFAKDGATLAICSTNDEKAKAIATEIADEFGVKAIGKGVDIALLIQRQHLLKMLQMNLGKLMF